MPAQPNPRNRALGNLLRAARERERLSQAELARRLRISTRALIHYEAGREPAHLHLERYLAAFPFLTARDLLQVPDRAAAHHDERAWPLLRDLIGVEADSISVTVRRSAREIVETTRISRLRTVTPALAASADVVTALMRAACLASPGRLRNVTLEAADGRDVLDIDEPPHRHRIRLRKDPRDGVDYERVTRREPQDDESFIALHDVVHCVESLEISFDIDSEPPAGLTPALAAWPAIVGFDPTWDAAVPLYREASSVTVGGHRVSARITRPMPGLRHGVGWLKRSSAPPLPPRGASVGARLRQVRTARGLVLRDMGKRVRGVAPATILNAERGGRVAHRTLKGYLDAFPDLAAEDLFPVDARQPMSENELWRHQRDAFGLVADEIIKRSVIDQDGFPTVTVRIVGLRRLRRGGEPLQLKHGEIRGVYQPRALALAAITGAPDARVRPAALPSDPYQHQVVRFEKVEGRRGLTFTLRHAPAKVPIYVAAHVRRAAGEPVKQEGSSHWVRFPCERLRVQVTLPRGFPIARHYGHACPWRIPPDVDLPLFSQLLRSPDVVARERDGAVTLAIVVDRPVVGLKLGLAWDLP